MLILGAVTALSAFAAEPLAIDDEIPPEGSDWLPRSRVQAAYAFQGGRLPRPRLHLDLQAAWLRGCMALDGSSLESPRGGIQLRKGDWSLSYGRSGGRWGGGLLLEPRRRPGLGRPAAPLREAFRAIPTTSTLPLLRGAVLEGRAGPIGIHLAALAAAERQGDWLGHACGLSWGAWRASLIQGQGVRALALAAQWGGEAFAVDQEAALLRSEAGGWRRAWRSRLRGTPGPVAIACEAIVLDGTAAGEERALLRGWISAGEGVELHAALSGEGSGWDWRLARRHRQGLGLAAGAAKRETGLELHRRLGAGRLAIAWKRITQREEVDLSSAPGFPRRRQIQSVEEELACAWRGPLRLRWLVREGPAGARSQYLGVGGDLEPPLPLAWQCGLFEGSAGARSFLIMDGGSLHRQLDSISGGGWSLRLGGEWRRGALLLKAGSSYIHRRAEADRAALWLECRWERG